MEEKQKGDLKHLHFQTIAVDPIKMVQMLKSNIAAYYILKTSVLLASSPGSSPSNGVQRSPFAIMVHNGGRA